MRHNCVIQLCGIVVCTTILSGFRYFPSSQVVNVDHSQPWIEMFGFFGKISSKYRLSEQTNKIFPIDNRSTDLSMIFLKFCQNIEIYQYFCRYIGKFLDIIVVAYCPPTRCLLPYKFHCPPTLPLIFFFKLLHRCLGDSNPGQKT